MAAVYSALFRVEVPQVCLQAKPSEVLHDFRYIR
jgi:hypothetical protein